MSLDRIDNKFPSATTLSDLPLSGVMYAPGASSWNGMPAWSTFIKLGGSLAFGVDRDGNVYGWNADQELFKKVEEG